MCVWVQNISSVALYIRHVAVHLAPKMVLSYYFYGEMVLQNCDPLVGTHGANETLLNLMTCVVGVVQDAEFRVSALAMQVEFSILVLVEVHSPPHQVSDALRGIPHHLLHSFRVTNEVARHHCVVDMLLEVIHFQVRDRCHAALSFVRVSLVYSSLADQGHLALTALRHLQRITQPGNAGADNEEVEFSNHLLLD